MIPRLWSYFLLGYLRILGLSLSTFISVLIVSRFREIARFTALSGSWSKTLLFTLYQIPFILPLALPISALIASFLLVSRLSLRGEITACRAAGKSLPSLLAPLWLLGAFLSCFAFVMTAEITPFCKAETKRLLFEKTSTNPLLLLQRQALVPLKNASIHMEVAEGEAGAQNLLCVSYNDSHQRLSLLTAKKLFLEEKTLVANDVTLLSHLSSEEDSFFDPLVVENQKTLRTSAPKLSQAMRKKKPKLEPSTLRFKLLSLYAKGEKTKQKQIVFGEQLRRIFLPLYVLSFTILGSVFGLHLGRSDKQKNFIALLSLPLLSFIGYFLAKSLRTDLLFLLTPLLFPLLLTLGISFFRLYRIERGFS